MKRRLFLAKAVAWVGALLGISTVSAEGDVGIPVEDCPCCCTADEGVTWYSCDDWGNALPGDPAGCEALLPEEEEPTPEDDWTDDDDWTPAEEPERVPVDWSAVEFPNTGSGPMGMDTFIQGPLPDGQPLTVEDFEDLLRDIYRSITPPSTDPGQ